MSFALIALSLYAQVPLYPYHHFPFKFMYRFCIRYCLLMFFIGFASPWSNNIAYAQTSKSKMLKPDEAALRQKVGSLDTTKILKIQNIVKAYGGLKWFSGSIIVAKNGVPVYKTAGGLASLDYKVPCALDTKFNLFELSQPFTALAIAQLAEKGKVIFSEPAYRYLPDSVGSLVEPSITLHHLLTHTAGLPDYYRLPEYNANFSDLRTISDLLKIILAQPTRFEAGEQFEHSNSNYVLLAAIIEHVTQKDYTDYIRKEIFKPAGMKQSDLYSWYQVVGNKAAAYQFSGKHKARTAADLYGAYPFGADAIYSTGDDLLLFDKALRGNVLLDDAYQDKLFTPYVIPDTTLEHPETWGYGWKVKTLNGKQVVYQTGNQQGLSTEMRRYLDERFTVLVLSNQHLDRATEVADKIELALFNDSYFVPSGTAAYLVYNAMEKNGIDYAKKHIDAILSAENLSLASPQLLNKLALELIYARKYDLSLAAIQINEQKFPRDPSVLDTYGEYYYQAGDLATSIRYFKEKLAVKPTDKRAAGMIQSLSMQKRPIKDYILPKNIDTTGNASAITAAAPTSTQKTENKAARNPVITSDKPVASNTTIPTSTQKTEDKTARNPVITSDKPVASNTTIPTSTQKTEDKTATSPVITNDKPVASNTTISTNAQETENKTINTTSSSKSMTSSTVIAAEGSSVYSAPNAMEGKVAPPIETLLPIDAPQNIKVDTSAPRLVYVAMPIVSAQRLPSNTATFAPPAVFNEDIAAAAADSAKTTATKGSPAAIALAPKASSPKATANNKPIATQNTTVAMPDKSGSEKMKQLAAAVRKNKSINLPQQTANTQASTIIPASSTSKDSIYTIVQEMPEFPGGQTAAHTYLSQNLIYPSAAAEHQIRGTVYVRFLITKEGYLKNPEIERGMVGNDYGCHDEAIRLVNSMPRWTPGKQNGKAVDVRYTLAIPFKP